MNDLRYDPADPTDAHAPDLREPTCCNIPAVKRVDELRTVAMPELRSPQAREFDAKARDLRTHSERVDAELSVLREAIERIADLVQVLWLEREIAQMERDGAIRSDME